MAHSLPGRDGRSQSVHVRRGVNRQPRLRDDRVLMVRERGPVAEGRHLGQQYWTLPRGGTPARREPRS